MTTLNLNSKKKQNVSTALWITVIWMFYSAAKPISFWLYPMASTSYDMEGMQYMEGSSIDRNILTVLILLSIYVLSKRNIEWISIFRNNIFIVLLFIFCGASIIWSDYPSVSFRRWIKEIGIALSILVVLTEEEPVRAVKILIKRFSYIAITSSILLILLFPDIGIYGYLGPGIPNYAGVSWNKNALGRICLVSGIFFFYSLASMRGKNKSKTDNITARNKEKVFIQYIFLIITFFLLYILHSATSLGGFFIGVFTYLALGTNVIKRNVKFLSIFIFIAIVAGVIIQYSFNLIEAFVAFMGRDLTFTGRTFIWKDLLYFGGNPLIGVGYGSFWLGERIIRIQKLWTDLNECHNGYLFVYLELGMVGLCLLAGVISSFYRNIRKELLYTYDYGRFQMAILIVVLLYNITEDGFARLHLIWYVFLLVGIYTRPQLKLNISEKLAPIHASL